VRRLPLVERKRLLRAIVPKRSSAILCASHVAGRGVDLFREVRAQDLEGIVAKRKTSTYDAAALVSPWAKVKNREYSPARDRHELFAREGCYRAWWQGPVAPNASETVPARCWWGFSLIDPASPLRAPVAQVDRAQDS
jgi:ATP dependent DNA ligase-like protein